MRISARLRATKLADAGEGLWRLAPSEKHNADLYPTHGLGPVAQCMNIKPRQPVRAAGFDGQSVARADLYAAKAFGPTAEGQNPYALSDVVTTLIQTAAGQTIVITHNTDSPRAYSRDIFLQGTKGLVRKYPRKKSTSKAVARTTHGSRWKHIVRSMSIRCGRSSRSARKAAATEAWTSSRTIA